MQQVGFILDHIYQFRREIVVGCLVYQIGAHAGLIDGDIYTANVRTGGLRLFVWLVGHQDGKAAVFRGESVPAVWGVTSFICGTFRVLIQQFVGRFFGGVGCRFFGRIFDWFFDRLFDWFFDRLFDRLFSRFFGGIIPAVGFGFGGVGGFGRIGRGRGWWLTATPAGPTTGGDTYHQHEYEHKRNKLW